MNPYKLGSSDDNLSVTSVLRLSQSRTALFSTSDQFPLLPLPNGLASMTFKESRIIFSDNKTSVYIPEVDTILNDYAAASLAVQHTIEFIEFVESKFQTNFTDGLKNNKLDYAVNLYAKIYNLPLIMNMQPIRDTLTFYLNSLFPNSFSSGLWGLKASLSKIEKEYIERLKRVAYIRSKQRVQLNESNAKQFIDIANKEIEKDLNAYFSGVKLLAKQVDNLGGLTEKGREAKKLLDNPKVRAFLVVIRYAEAYKRVLGGGGPMEYNEASNFVKLPDYNDHPGKILPGGGSSAAGAYQIMTKTWFGEGKDIGAKRILGLSDFTPESQDIFAAYKIIQKGVANPLLADDFASAVQAGSSEWASFPDKRKGDPETNPRSRFPGQPAAPLSWLEDKYKRALKGELK